MAESTLSDAARRALSEFGELTTAHKEFVDRYERNRRAYEGVIEPGSDAAQTAKIHVPPYAEHIIETTISSLLDEQFRFSVKPRGRLFMSPRELEGAALGAKACELLLTAQLKDDRFDEKQRPLVLQERLAGLSPAKVYYKQKGRPRRRTTWSVDERTGMAVWNEVEEPAVTQEGACVEVVDVRDFFWEDEAVSLDDSSICVHRTWPTFEFCKLMQRSGWWRNVDELPETRSGLSANLAERERGSPDKKRGRIEVLEIWRREDTGKMRVYTIGNRSVLLKEDDNPFHHGEFPFVMFVGQSRPFRIPGRAQIEKLADAQSALWTILNTRLENLMFVNNAISIFNEDLVEDIDAMEFYSGARWAVHGDVNAAVTMWQPTPMPAQVSIPAESMMKADMQNLGGGFPFTSTSEAQTVAASTATQASLTASLAQRSIVSAKRHLYDSYRRIGQMMLELNQQFTREPVYALVVGADDLAEQQEILPWMLEGDYVFDIEPMTESLMRQERRAEAVSLFSTIMPSVPVAASTGTLINTRKAYENLLESFDVQNVDAWFTQQPQQPGAPGAPQQNGGVPGMGTPASPDNGGGVTNPSLAAGPLAVSNPNSMAPGAMSQQMMADTSGRNA